MKKLCIAFAIVGLILTVCGGIIMAVFETHSYNHTPRIPATELVEETAISQTTYETTVILDTNNESVDPDNDTAQNLEVIYINATIGEITIKNGEKFSIDTDNIDESHFSHSLSNGVLDLNYDAERFNDTAVKNSEIIITVTDNDIQEINITADLASINVENINTDILNAYTNAGVIVIKDSVIRNYSFIEIDVGAIELKDTSLHDTQMNIDLGSINADNCIMTGNTVINNDLGKCSLDLIGDISDYNFTSNVDMGELKINDKKVCPDNPDAENIFEINLDNGKVDIEIKK